MLTAIGFTHKDRQTVEAWAKRKAGIPQGEPWPFYDMRRPEVKIKVRKLSRQSGAWIATIARNA